MISKQAPSPRQQVAQAACVFWVNILQLNLFPEHPQIGIASSHNMLCPKAAFPKSHCAIDASKTHRLLFQFHDFKL